MDEMSSIALEGRQVLSPFQGWEERELAALFPGVYTPGY